MKMIMECLAMMAAIATIFTQSATQTLDRDLHSEKNIRHSNLSPLVSIQRPNSSSIGKFTIKPDDNGRIDFDSTLARNFQRAIDGVRLKYMSYGGISAAISIPGKGTWLGVAGFSNPTNSLKPDMLFSIGSNTKGFISAILLQLQEEGKLSLDDSIGSFLPSFKNISGKITIRQLLNMRSGLYDFYNSSKAAEDSLKANPNRVWTPEEILTTFVGPPRMQPGGTFQYCNTNLILAGMIIRQITKSSISSQLHQRILSPLSMTNTFLPVEDSIYGTMAAPWYLGNDYSWFFGKAASSMLWTAGAMVSTAEDAVRWSNAFYGGKLLSPVSQAQIFSVIPQPNAYTAGLIVDGYGLCVGHLTFMKKELWGHNGTIAGYISNIFHHPSTGMSVAVLLNSSNTGGYYTEDLASAELLHEYFKTLPAADAVAGQAYVLGTDSVWMSTLDTFSSTLKPLGRSQYGTIASTRIRRGKGELYGLSNAVGWELVQVDGATGEAYPRAVLTFASTPADLKGMAFSSDGTLYIGAMDGKLYTVDMKSGTATLIASTGINIAGIDFHPRTGQLWASVRPAFSEKDRIYKINLPSGDTIRVGATGFGQITQDIAFDPSGNLYGLIGSGADVNRLARIDTATGVGTIIGSFGISKLNTFALSGTISSVSTMASYPVEFTLSQNYPNPFNSATHIQFSISDVQFVKLCIYDILGREVAVLVNEKKEPGDYTVRWDASKMSSGVYFYQLTAGDYSDVKRMFYLK